MNKNNYVTKRYSESFKLKILSELSTGKYSKHDLTQQYGIYVPTINRWIKKYNRVDLMNKRVLVQEPDEVSKLQALQKEMEPLKKLLLKMNLEFQVKNCFRISMTQENHCYKNAVAERVNGILKNECVA
ncbi:transposase [Tenuifilum thalassicum]|uniref:Transposase n=1 Tax=Tenuifilum thalassicum TaxID=2590900 RepID=A0A7D4BEM1_9BACT|nr:transposase [Tenuifilum thalassicum]QKG80058.1 transposase [Tenuifilum thalassicum]